MKALLITGFFLIMSCSTIKDEQSIKQDQYDAINDFLETQIKDKTKEIIVLKEKSSTDETIKIFRGGVLEFSDSARLVRLEKPIRDGGVNFPLYNEKDWKKMKNKYGNKKGDSLENIEYWTEKDFRYKKIIFVTKEEYQKKFSLPKYFDSPDPEREVYRLSSPIPYKRKYLTFDVYSTMTKLIPHSDDFIVVMKKENGKWVVIQKVSSNGIY